MSSPSGGEVFNRTSGLNVWTTLAGIQPRSVSLYLDCVSLFIGLCALVHTLKKSPLKGWLVAELKLWRKWDELEGKVSVTPMDWESGQ